MKSTSITKPALLAALSAILVLGCSGEKSPTTGAFDIAAGLESSVVEEQTKALGKIDESNKDQYLDKAVALLDSEEPLVRQMAMSAMVHTKHTAAKAKILDISKNDKDAGTRGMALSCLNELGAKDEYLAGCKAILAGDDASVKGEIIMALRDEGKESLTAVKAELEALASGSDKDLASQAKDALKMLE